MTNPSKSWYQGRAAAESVKTLSWRYTVAGDPFPAELTEAAADKIFVERLRDVLVDMDRLTVTIGGEGEEITEWMRNVRGAPLAERKQDYAQGRIADQRTWYSTKAAWNTRRAQRWGLAMLLFEASAVIQALLKATGIIDVDILGFIATVIAGMFAWVHLKDYDLIANAYSVAARELAAIGALIRHQETEAEWAKFVADAEESISREHTLWRASRT